MKLWHYRFENVCFSTYSFYLVILFYSTWTDQRSPLAPLVIPGKGCLSLQRSTTGSPAGAACVCSQVAGESQLAACNKLLLRLGDTAPFLFGVENKMDRPEVLRLIFKPGITKHFKFKKDEQHLIVEETLTSDVNCVPIGSILVKYALQMQCDIAKNIHI